MHVNMSSQKKLKVLYCIQLPPPVHGVTTVNKFIWESELINKRIDKRIIKIDYASSLEDIDKFSFGKVLKFIKISLKVIYQTIFWRPKYMYLTIPPVGVGFIRDSFLIQIAKLTGIIPVLHLHGIGIQNRVKTKTLRNYYRFVLKGCEIIHLSKGLINQELQPLGLNSAKYHEVENGVGDFKEIPVHQRTGKRILFLSNLVQSKGILVTIDAFSSVTKKFPDVELIVVGGRVSEEDDRKIAEKLKERGGKGIKFKGAVYGDEKFQLMQQCDLFILPTFNDTFPLVILEAMQAGLPIISSRVGAIPEIVEEGKNGFIIESGDTSGLIEKIELLLENDEVRFRMGEESRKRFLEKYTLRKFEERMEKLFSAFSEQV